MRTEKIKCAACNGTGKWMSPAVVNVEGGINPEAICTCVTCGGHKVLTREIERPQRRKAA